MAEIGIDIKKAKSLLEQGELVAIPTETVYGLAANALDPTSVTKIFVAKERPTFDPLIVHVASVEQAIELTASMPDKARVLTNKFWPGPLTVVLPKKLVIPDIVTSGLNTVAIRCPNHDLTKQLLSSLDFPLAAPSANPFGYISPTTAQHVNDQLGNKIKYILDGGACKIGLESTIVGFENNEVVLYRRGSVSEEEIMNLVGPVKTRLVSNSNPTAPGQLEMHYAPRKTILLGDIDKLEKNIKDKKVGFLRFQHQGSPQKDALYLSKSGNLEEAARNLFAFLRQLDQMDVDLILAEMVPDVGIGKAINDRLIRAAASKK